MPPRNINGWYQGARYPAVDPAGVPLLLGLGVLGYVYSCISYDVPGIPGTCISCLFSIPFVLPALLSRPFPAVALIRDHIRALGYLPRTPTEFISCLICFPAYPGTPCAIPWRRAIPLTNARSTKAIHVIRTTYRCLQRGNWQYRYVLRDIYTRKPGYQVPVSGTCIISYPECSARVPSLVMGTWYIRALPAKTNIRYTSGIHV